ncbi:MAG: hypothetical protein DCO96_10350 [Fluviicola sp. XM-24bin1]|nr:MAG: hypothetical protein DCO96_10350 [Fluviicola sp. XM-24bin1]
MKRTLFCFLALVILVVACDAKGEVSEPEDIGPQVMQILEGLNDISEPEFSEHFITHKQLHEIADNKQLVKDDEQRRSMKSVTKTQVKVRYAFMFQRLQSAGKRYGIDWKDIKFVAFKHKEEEIKGVKFCYGELKFKHRSNSYVIETSSIFDGSSYKLTSIEGLKEL